MRAVLLTGSSFALTAAVILNGYYQKKQFYPSVVYITKSNASMAVLYIQALVLVVLTGKIMRKIFFGQLRAAEMEHLIERSWYAVTETCLAFTVFRDDFSPRFVASFTLLLFLKSFHWLAEDRVDYMERSPLISCVFHTRVISLLMVLGSLDVYFVNYAYYSTIMKGASVQLVFGFEYAILLTVVFMTFMKYVMHTIDLQNENPWENKAVYLLYSELVIGTVRVALYIAFMVIMIKVHTFPLFAIRPMYIALRTFKKALHDVIMSRRAIRNMNTLYQDATEEEISAGDGVCIICREEMSGGGSCKKLPCNHIYHSSCLRSWFQRQQTCPTCRMDVLNVPRPTPPPPATPQAQAPQAPQPHGLVPPVIPPFNVPGYPMWLPGALPPQQHFPQQLHPQQQQQVPVTGSTVQAAPQPHAPVTDSAAASTTAQFVIPPPPPHFFPTQPPFMPQMPFSDFPRPIPDLSSLSDEELKMLEGHERHNVESRITWLRDIQTLLDTSMMLINQYNDVTATLSLPVISTLRSPDNATLSAASTQTVTSPLSQQPKTSTLPPDNSDITEKLLPDGAQGYTPPSTVGDVVTDVSAANDEVHEVRRRRIERFASSDRLEDMSKSSGGDGSESSPLN